MMKSVGKPYQFQYETSTLTNPKTPIEVTTTPLIALMLIPARGPKPLHCRS
jgi:hypothetical protein